MSENARELERFEQYLRKDLQLTENTTISYCISSF